MKKALLVSILFLFSILYAQAYETVIIKHPPEEMWHKVYYKKIGDEAILQYVPKNQTQKNWNKAIIIHSYYMSGYPVNVFITNELIRMNRANPSGRYKYLKLTADDSIAGRCTKDYKGIKSQCEFYRVAKVHEGIITIHYINRDKDDFMENYKLWYEIIKKAKFLNTYWRNERTLNKPQYFELW